MQKKGFTLAEVLITLGIIGIVAAMTIPTLMANNQKSQYVTSLKKFYSGFNQTLLLLANDYGCTGNLKCTGLFTDTTTFAEALLPYFKVIKNCQTTADNGCMPSKVNPKFDGTGTAYSEDSSGYRFITTDGVAIKLIVAAADCSVQNTAHKTNNLAQICGNLVVDVNGPGKGPNFVGRDVYNFMITNGHGPLLYPYGGLDDLYDHWQSGGCGIGANMAGLFCASRIIDEGWQMNY